MKPSIQLINVHKSFNIPREKRDTLKEKIIHFRRRVKYEEFKALSNIDLFIDEGEFVGIIGKNGSGKSTLLKLIANIYSPTIGQVESLGTVSPFLELGIGFNGDMSGRENLYLNGVILGLKRSQIDRMYKKIVQFAGLEEFMELKLKNYSSGMQVRLAFAIASAVDTDIYLCDEVLAVGDIDFQKKCLKVFKDLKKRGKTIILVSHDLDLIEQFCDRTIYLKGGQIVMDGKTKEVIDMYKK